MAANPDSFDRIVSYFQALANTPFEYREKKYTPYRGLVVSTNVFRDYTCPSGCGACCMRVSLVFDRPRPSDLPPINFHEFRLNGRHLDFPVDVQADRQNERFCRHLDGEGRCGIYEYRPLPCRFELFKFIHNVSRNRAVAMVHLPGRGFKLLRVDQSRGAKCEITPYNPDLTKTHVDDLRIIAGWMDYFGIGHDCKAVINYLETGPHVSSLEIVRRRLVA